MASDAPLGAEENAGEVYVPLPLMDPKAKDISKHYNLSALFFTGLLVADDVIMFTYKQHAFLASLVVVDNDAQLLCVYPDGTKNTCLTVSTWCDRCIDWAARTDQCVRSKTAVNGFLRTCVIRTRGRDIVTDNNYLSPNCVLIEARNHLVTLRQRNLVLGYTKGRWPVQMADTLLPISLQENPPDQLPSAGVPLDTLVPEELVPDSIRRKSVADITDDDGGDDDGDDVVFDTGAVINAADVVARRRRRKTGKASALPAVSRRLGARKPTSAEQRERLRMMRDIQNKQAATVKFLARQQRAAANAAAAADSALAELIGAAAAPPTRVDIGISHAVGADAIDVGTNGISDVQFGIQDTSDDGDMRNFELLSIVSNLLADH